ncbi:TetR/AcrR family transcriptional regulator [Flavobacterium sp.]|uniref:TetR/AcrR family transcriptional regulator n=1 Tax=Flavobacterium sp. TaxID=239 RepID=UPI00120D8017|nr:TetR/AcrR family transcriptional regulator [Flavobacterium sp.]RZJ69797.1 MAG: TetR/AcrR family transcriptional regulator [Flavobacterium sp.]
MRVRDENKEKLVINKAIDLFVTEGLQGFSMNKLAKACGISVATLYIYYRDKDDLINKIANDTGEKFFEMSLRGFSPDMSFADGLRVQWQNRFDYAYEYPRELAFFEMLRASHYNDEVLRARLGVFKQQMTEFFHNSIARKELIPLDVTTFWCIAYGPLYSMIRFHQEGKAMGGQPFKITKEAMDKALELCIKALTP